MVTFKSIDKNLRKATFTVNGKDITRKIPKKFTGSIDDHLRALARGLAIENKKIQEQSIETPTIKPNDILIPDNVEE